MLGKNVVLSLEDDWREALDRIASRRRWPTTRDVKRLGAEVAALSTSYNDPENAPQVASRLAARLLFSFVRDVPKGAAAVRELVATGLLAAPAGRPLRVLDVGAGLGATTWGVARALEAAGHGGPIEAVWIDSDGAALELGLEIAAAKGSASGLRPRAVRGEARRARSEERADLVLVGQVLTELDRDRPEEERVRSHADMLRGLADHALAADGSLVVIEPALRDRTRHLHRVRDSILAAPAASLAVFAPCLHATECPALPRDGDWCHEDLPVDLPDWLVPVAKAAGLRYQGLTFSYLVLRKDGATLSRALPSVVGPRLRVVSDAIVSKGKREAFVCGSLGTAGQGARVRLMRLDRDRREANEAWDDLARGDILAVDPAPDPERARIGPSSTVTKAG